MLANAIADAKQKLDKRLTVIVDAVSPFPIAISLCETSGRRKLAGNSTI
jgi:uroporphyrinogen-III decarboxylase